MGYFLLIASTPTPTCANRRDHPPPNVSDARVNHNTMSKRACPPTAFSAKVIGPRARLSRSRNLRSSAPSWADAAAAVSHAATSPSGGAGSDPRLAAPEPGSCSLSSFPSSTESASQLLRREPAWASMLSATACPSWAAQIPSWTATSDRTRCRAPAAVFRHLPRGALFLQL